MTLMSKRCFALVTLVALLLCACARAVEESRNAVEESRSAAEESRRAVEERPAVQERPRVSFAPNMRIVHNENELDESYRNPPMGENLLAQTQAAYDREHKRRVLFGKEERKRKAQLMKRRDDQFKKEVQEEKKKAEEAEKQEHDCIKREEAEERAAAKNTLKERERKAVHKEAHGKRLKKQKEEKKRKQEKKRKRARLPKTSPLTLKSGWRPYGHGYETPSAQLSQKWCVLTGLIRGGRARHGLIAVLGDPKCRPSARTIFTVSVANKPGRVDVLPNGHVVFVQGRQGSWLSLDGIAFETHSKKGNKKGDEPFALVNGWQPYKRGYLTPQQEFSRLEHICTLRGLTTMATSRLIGTAREECRPRDGRLIFVGNFHRRMQRMDVLRNGQVHRVLGRHHKWRHPWLGLSAMWFPKGGKLLPLAGGWTRSNYEHGYRAGKFRVQNGICLVSGLVKTSRWPSRMALLPTECRPSRRLIFQLNQHDNTVRVDVLPSGWVLYVTGRRRYHWVSLSGIQFVVKQQQQQGLKKKK